MRNGRQCHRGRCGHGERARERVESRRLEVHPVMARRLPDTPAGPRTRPRPQLAPSGLAAQVDAVTARWAVDGAHGEQTLARMTETTRRFAARLQALGVFSFADVTPLQARGFVTAVTSSGTPPEVATQHARRTAVRTLYRT